MIVNIQLKKRLLYALDELWMGMVSFLVAIAGVIELVRDGWRLADGQGINWWHFIEAIIITPIAIWAFRSVFSESFRFPLILSSRIELDGNTMRLYTRAGRCLVSMKDVMLEISPKKKICIHTADNDQDVFYIPFYLIDEQQRDELLRSIQL